MKRFEYLGKIDRSITVDGISVGLATYPRQRLFGGWYDQTHVIIDGYDVGKLDTKRQNKRTTSGTTFFGVSGHSSNRGA